MSITIGTVILMPVDIAEVETISVAASATPVAAGTPDYDFVVTVTTSGLCSCCSCCKCF